MPNDVTLATVELRGDEQRHGRVLRDVFDCGGATAHAVSAGSFRVQSEHDTILRLCGSAWDCAACWIAKGQGLACGDAWVRGIVRDRGLQIKSVSSKAKHEDLGTKVLPVAKLNALQAACGIVVFGEPACEPINEGERLNDALSDEFSGALDQVVK